MLSPLYRLVLFVAVLAAAPWARSAEEPAPRYLPEHRILAAAQEGRWRHVLDLCDRLEETLDARPKQPAQPERPPPYGLRSSRHLLEWARAVAHDQLAGEKPSGLGGLTGAARHPLVEQLSKESYNLVQEFDAALAAGDFRHACRLLTEFADPQDWGLLRDPRDPRLMVNLPMEIELAVFRHPELTAAMEEHFGELGLLRVRQAIGRGHEAAVEAAAWRFYGSRASAEAQQWLGDRHLSRGQAVEATEHYTVGLTGASPSQREGLLGRSRLAAALLGFDVGEPPSRTLELGQLAVPPERFETIVAALIEVRSEGATLAIGANRGGDWSRATCPPPAAYAARPWAPLNLRSNPMPAGIDWAARQIAAVPVEDNLLVASTGQLAVFDARTGDRAWGRQWAGWNRNPWWALDPTQPVVDGDRVYLRYVSPQGYQLVCVDAATGSPHWGSDPQLAVASDPLLVGDALIAFSAERLAGNLLGLSLVVLDADTGHLRNRVSIAQFRSHRNAALPCRVTAVGNRIVATAAGAVLCCDFAGEVQWIRRQLWMPPVEQFEEAALWHPQIHRPPLVLRGQVLATQPGVWSIEALDLRTGRLLWRAAPPGLQSLGGHYRGRVVVETSYGLTALDPASGRTLWNHPVDLRLAALRCGPPGGIAYARLDEPAGEPQRRAALVWLHPATGRPIYRLPLGLPGLEESETFLGPLVVAGGRQWIFAAPVARPHNRQIFELTE